MRQISLSTKTEVSEEIILERWEVISTLHNEVNQKISPKSEELLYFLLTFLVEKNTFDNICDYISSFWMIVLLSFLGSFVYLLKVEKVK